MAMLHIAEGDLESASLCAWKAWMQNPQVRSLGSLVCWYKYLQGEHEQGLESVAQVRGNGGCGAIESLFLIHAGTAAGNVKRIEEIASDFPQNQTLQGALDYSIAVSKRTSQALEILHNLEQLHAPKKPNNAYGRALVLIGLGKGSEEVQDLEAAYAEGSSWSLGFRSDPALRRLHGEPRYELLVRTIGAPTVTAVPGARRLEFITRAASNDEGRQIDRKLVRA
jgi:hypothetical protein